MWIHSLKDARAYTLASFIYPFDGKRRYLIFSCALRAAPFLFIALIGKIYAVTLAVFADHEHGFFIQY